MGLKRKLAEVKFVENIICTVFLGSLLINMVTSQATINPSDTTTLANVESETSILTRLISLRATSFTSTTIRSTKSPSMPSSTNHPSIPSSAHAVSSTIQNPTTSLSDMNSVTPADQRTLFPTDQMTTTKVADAVTTSRETTVESLLTTLKEQSTPLNGIMTTNFQGSTPRKASTASMIVATTNNHVASSETILTTDTPPHEISQAISSKPPNFRTTIGQTFAENAGTTDQTSSISISINETPSSERTVIISNKITESKSKITTKSLKATTKPPKTSTEQRETTADRNLINSTVTDGGSSSSRDPLLSIPQWFAVFLGTFLTIFLIFLTNVWYNAKMSSETTKPSIELVKSSKTNDRPKSWQESNVPLDFMSLHIELPKETKEEMKCAENLAFEGDQPNGSGPSNDSSMNTVTLTKL